MEEERLAVSLMLQKNFRFLLRDFRVVFLTSHHHMSSRSEFMQLDILEAPKQKNSEGKATARFNVIRKNVSNKIGNERLEDTKLSKRRSTYYFGIDLNTITSLLPSFSGFNDLCGRVGVSHHGKLTGGNNWTGLYHCECSIDDRNKMACLCMPY